MRQPKDLAKDILTYAILCVISLLSVFPLYWMVVSSIRPAMELLMPDSGLIPSRLTLDSYKRVIFNSPFFRFLKNSLVVTICTLAITLTFSSMAAHSLARMDFRGKDLISRGILLAYVFPQIVMVVPLFVAIVKMGLANSYLGLIITYITCTFPFATWMLTAYFHTIPKELEEAALIDGASNFQVFFKITLPLARPGLVSAAVFTFIQAWNEFLYALVILNSESRKTLSVGLYGLIGGEIMTWGEVLSMCTLMVIPTMVFFVLVQKHLVEGLTAGAVKG